MKAEDIIENSIVKVKDMGIEIVRGPRFIWTAEKLPQACDWSGAVLVAHDKATPGFSQGWLKEFCSIIGKDFYWFWRFNYGFSQLRALELFTEEGSKRVYIEDSVSKAGSSLAKKILK